MNEDSWLEAAYEDRNGGEVDTSDLMYQGPEDDCSRYWMESPCGGALIARTTAWGFPDLTCEGHLRELQATLDDIAERYPEIYHPAFCLCYGCSDSSW